MERKQEVVVYDNWYRKGYYSDPIHRDCYLNVTAMSALHTTEVAMYLVFHTLDDFLQRIAEVA